MAKQAKRGSVQEALSLQKQNNVPECRWGLWFHSSKDRETQLIEHPVPTFWTRSPHGWTGWGGDKAGDPLHVAYIVGPFSSPESKIVTPYVVGGDADGFENGVPLKDWWLVLQNEDIDKVWVVDLFPQNDQAKIATYRNAEEYIARRMEAVAHINKGDAKP